QPVSLAFGAVGVRVQFPFVSAGPSPLGVRGDLVMGDDTVIAADPKANVVLSGDTVTALGSVLAPGGTIAISAGKDSAALFLANSAQALPTVVLGERTRLSVSGTAVLLPDAFGRRVGSVLPGGSISLTGNLALPAGARLEAAGAADTLDLALGYAT